MCFPLDVLHSNKTGIYGKMIQVQLRNSYSAAVHQIEFTQGNFKRGLAHACEMKPLTRRIRELQRMHQNHASMRSILDLRKHVKQDLRVEHRKMSFVAPMWFPAKTLEILRRFGYLSFES